MRDIPDGASIMVSGFGLCGIPENLLAALREQGAKNLTMISNNAGTNDFGITILLQNKQVQEDDLDLRRREQGLREDGPGRRDRGGAEPAGHLRRADARRRGRRPGLLHAHRLRHARSPRARRCAGSAAGPTSWRRACAPTTRSSRPGRAIPLGNLLFRRTTRNFAPDDGHGRPHARSPRWSSSCPRAPSTPTR